MTRTIRSEWHVPMNTKSRVESCDVMMLSWARVIITMPFRPCASRRTCHDASRAVDRFGQMQTSVPEAQSPFETAPVPEENLIE